MSKAATASESHDQEEKEICRSNLIKSSTSDRQNSIQYRQYRQYTLSSFSHFGPPRSCAKFKLSSILDSACFAPAQSRRSIRICLGQNQPRGWRFPWQAVFRSTAKKQKLSALRHGPESQRQAPCTPVPMNGSAAASAPGSRMSQQLRDKIKAVGDLLSPYSPR